jgi:putative transposase
MKKTIYPSDITGQELELIKPCLNIRRQSKWPLLQLINAIFYICREGVQWRSLPQDFEVPWQTVYWYFSKWSRQGSWQAVNEQLVLVRRGRCGAQPLPSSLLIDSQTVANSPTATEHTGVDGGKRTKGRKRLLLTDSQGNLLSVLVFAAHRHDGATALQWWSETLTHTPLLSEAGTISGDQHFGGRFKQGVEKSSPVQVVAAMEPVTRTKQPHFTIYKKRWVVERTIAWETTSRRLARDYERKTLHAEAFLLISSVVRLLKNPVALN